MNRKQKAVIFAALALFVATLVWSPWKVYLAKTHAPGPSTASTSRRLLGPRVAVTPTPSWTETKVVTVYAPVWTPPNSAGLREYSWTLTDYQLQFGPMLVKWLGIGVVSFLLFRFLRTPGSKAASAAADEFLARHTK